VLFPGAVYHVTARGNDRRAIYRDDADRRTFLDTLGLAVERYGLLCHAYCLMGNHYHLVVETPRANLPIAMRQINGRYGRQFNNRWHRVGHVFQARYDAVLVQKDAHLLETVRYVALNPARTRPPLCDAPERWQWSSYAALVGLAPTRAWLTVDWVLAQFGTDYETARARLAAYVTDPRPLEKAGGIFFGAEPFVRAATSGLGPIPEVPRSHWQPIRPPLERLFTEDERAIVTAYRVYGYTLRELADHAGCHPATISRRLRRAEIALAASPDDDSPRSVPVSGLAFQQLGPTRP
jgi:REP element-mobilizing transposase RayT